MTTWNPSWPRALHSKVKLSAEDIARPDRKKMKSCVNDGIVRLSEDTERSFRIEEQYGSSRRCGHPLQRVEDLLSF